MKIDTDASDLYDFGVRMKAASARVGVDASRVLRDASKAAEEFQRSRMEAHRGSGDTINSIGTDFSGNGNSIEMGAHVGVTTYYWRFVEYGTVDIHADPVVARSGDAAASVLVLGLDDIFKGVE